MNRKIPYFEFQFFKHTNEQRETTESKIPESDIFIGPLGIDGIRMKTIQYTNTQTNKNKELIRFEKLPTIRQSNTSSQMRFQRKDKEKKKN